MSGGYFRLYYRKCPWCGFYQNVTGEILCDEPRNYLAWECEECEKPFMVKIILTNRKVTIVK